MGESLGPDSTCEFDDEAFVSLIASHQLVLTGFLRTLLRQHSDVDDVLQETNLVLWRKRTEYDFGRPFAAWACRIAHFQALSHLKNRGRRASRVIDEATLGHLAKLSMNEAGQMDQQLEKLQQCLRTLSGSHRDLIRARYLENRPVQRIAEMLGKTPHAISMSLYRLRGILRECMERSLRSEVS